jgi:hypothetical protein
MSQIKEIKDFIDKANEVQMGIAAKYRGIQDSIVMGKARIDKAELSDEAWKMMRDTFDKRMARELMHFSRDQKQQYHDNAQQAKKLSEQLIHAAVPKPDQEKLSRFERRLADIKTEILLSTPKKGHELLRDFIAGLDEPFFAEQVRTQYGELVTPILSAAGPDAARFKLELSHAFSQVKDITLTPEAREAIRLLESSDAILQSGVFGYAVQAAAAEHLGPRVSDYINQPETWFSANPDAAIVPPGQLTDEEAMVESVLSYQARAAAYVPPTNSPKPGGILPPSPFDNDPTFTV